MSESPLSPAAVRALELEDGIATRKLSQVEVFQEAVKLLNESDDPDKCQVFGLLMQSLAEADTFSPHHDHAVRVLTKAKPCKTDTIESLVKRVVKLAVKQKPTDLPGLVTFVINIIVSRESENLSKAVVKKLKGFIDAGDLEDSVAEWVVRFRGFFRRCGA